MVRLDSQRLAVPVLRFLEPVQLEVGLAEHVVQRLQRIVDQLFVKIDVHLCSVKRH